MALGELGKLDPLGRGIPKFGPAGPSALEVGMKRNDAEDAFAKGLYAQQAEQEAAKKVADAKVQETVKADLTPKTVWTPHAIRYADKHSALVDFYQQSLLRGVDPTDLRTPEGKQYLTMKRELGQYVAGSEQAMNTYDKVMLDIRGKDKDFFEPGTAEAFQASISNPDLLDKGEIAAPPVQMFNTEKYLDSIFGSIKASQTSTASADGTFNRDLEFTIPQDIKEVAQVAATNPYAKPNLERMYTEMTPNEQEFITALAKKNNMSRAGAMAYHYGTAKYLYQKETERSEQQNEAGSRRADEEAGLNWLAKITKATVEAKYTGTSNTVKTELTVANPGQKTYTTSVEMPEDLKYLRGFKLGKDMISIVSQTDNGPTTKNITGEEEITNLGYDRAKNEWLVEVNSTVGWENGKPVINQKRTLQFPADKFESNVFPALIANNKDAIAGIGKYVNTEQVSPNFEEKNAQNMTGANIPAKGGKPKGMYNPLTGKYEE